MIMNALTRLYCGMVYRLTQNGKRHHVWDDPEDVKWAGTEPQEEEELLSLINSIKTRLYTLKTVVEEQTEQIHRDLEDAGQIAQRKAKKKNKMSSNGPFDDTK